jgi:hypothetical protein
MSVDGQPGGVEMEGPINTTVKKLTQASRKVKRRVRIRIYAGVKDYDWLLKRKIKLENNGDLSIARMQQELAEERTCQVGLIIMPCCAVSQKSRS